MPHAEVIVEVTDHTGRRDAHIVYARQAATGNNPEFSNEMARRLLRIRLDAHLERPRQRAEFRHPDLNTWVRANRARLTTRSSFERSEDIQSVNFCWVRATNLPGNRRFRKPRAICGGNRRIRQTHRPAELARRHVHQRQVHRPLLQKPGVPRRPPAGKRDLLALAVPDPGAVDIDRITVKAYLSLGSSPAMAALSGPTPVTGPTDSSASCSNIFIKLSKPAMRQKLSKLFFTSSQATSFISEKLETLASASMDVVAFFMVLLSIQD